MNDPEKPECLVTITIMPTLNKTLPESTAFQVLWLGSGYTDKMLPLSHTAREHPLLRKGQCNAGQCWQGVPKVRPWVKSKKGSSGHSLQTYWSAPQIKVTFHKCCLLKWSRLWGQKPQDFLGVGAEKAQGLLWVFSLRMGMVELVLPVMEKAAAGEHWQGIRELHFGPALCHVHEAGASQKQCLTLFFAGYQVA